MAGSGRFSCADVMASSRVDEKGGRALSPREARYCEELAEGATACQAAMVAGISERTGRRWRQRRREIGDAIRARQAESMAIGRAVLVSGVAKCARSLVSMGAGETDADAARVSACRVVLDTASGWSELADMMARLEVLEAQEEKHEGR